MFLVRNPKHRMKTRSLPHPSPNFLLGAVAACGLLCLSALLTGCATKSSGKGWITLFDGRSATGSFRGFRQSNFPTNSWIVENGVLKTVRGNGVDLITREKFLDFQLELDWKVTPGANSGILYGVSEVSPQTYWTGPEMQIADDPSHPDGRVPKTSAGALYDLLAPNKKKRLKPTGEYNHVRIRSRRGHIEHWLNGAKIVEYDWGSPSMRTIVGQSKFKDAPYFMKDRNGYIALQHHGDEVWFRNIRIRRL